MKRRHIHSKKRCRAFVATHIKRHIYRYGMTRRQAIAAALTEARAKGCKV